MEAEAPLDAEARHAAIHPQDRAGSRTNVALPVVDSPVSSFSAASDAYTSPLIIEEPEVVEPLDQIRRSAR
jgi:hypothetical protein